MLLPCPHIGRRKGPSDRHPANIGMLRRSRRDGRSHRRMRSSARACSEHHRHRYHERTAYHESSQHVHHPTARSVICAGSVQASKFIFKRVREFVKVRRSSGGSGPFSKLKGDRSEQQLASLVRYALVTEGAAPARAQRRGDDADRRARAASLAHRSVRSRSWLRTASSSAQAGTTGSSRWLATPRGLDPATRRAPPAAAPVSWSGVWSRASRRSSRRCVTRWRATSRERARRPAQARLRAFSAA